MGALHVAHALGRSADFDLVHNHLDWLPLAFSDFAGRPWSPRSTASPRLGSSGGVDPAVLPFDADGGDALVCLGRIHPDRGTAEAVEIARRAGRRLVVCGPVQDERYFSERVAPHVDGDQVRHLGSVGPDERAEILGGAGCLLHPVSFAEPFGLSVVESMMCGTPVVAYPRGAMSEIVENGVTALLDEGVDAAVAAVDVAVQLDRAPAGPPPSAASRPSA